VRWLSFVVVAAIPCTLTAVAVPAVGQRSAAQPVSPDFSGVWSLDVSRSDPAGVYGEVRVVTQTPDAVHMAAFELTTRFREVWVAAGTPYVPQIAIAPWKLRFNRFGPRRGGDYSREPLVQARWDANSLVVLKQLGENSFAWIWTLIKENEMNAETFDGVSPQFDFKRSSLRGRPASYKHIYAKVPSSEVCESCDVFVDATGFHRATAETKGVTFRLSSTSAATATCRDITCQVNGPHSRILARGESAALSLNPDIGQWDIRLLP
jgi:hypothetical protein